MILKDFDETFDYQFEDPEFVTTYISVSLEDFGMEGLLTALRDVVRAKGGVAKVAQEAGLNRESLYKSLSKDGNPQLATILAVLKALGLKMSISQQTELTGPESRELAAAAS